MKQTKTNISWAFLALLLGLLWMPNAAKAQTVEDGSAEHPFLIENIQQLKDLAMCVNSGKTFYYTDGTYDTTQVEGAIVILPGGIDKYFRLANDIVLNTGNVAGCNGVKEDEWEEWIPIGDKNADNHFKGDFDGANHAISGLYVNDPSGVGVGCFGVISSGAHVHHLAVVNSFFKGMNYVGGITGMNVACTIDHCLNASTIMALPDNNIGGLYAGGICGANTITTSGHSVIHHCINTGYIKSGVEDAGGIAGTNENDCTIEQCLTVNHVKGIEGVGSIRPLCGVNNGTVSDSYFDMYLSPSNNSVEYGTGVSTAYLCNPILWHELDDEFVFTSNYYPQLKCFADANAALSTLVSTPITLSALDQDITGLENDIALGGSNVSVQWSNTNPTRSNITGNTLHLLAQGRFVLNATLGNYTKAYYLVSQKEPLMGSEANPFIIASLDDWYDFQKGINSGRTFLLDDYTVPRNGNGTYFLLAKDLDLNRTESEEYMDWNEGNTPANLWTAAIGTTEQPFKGHFDGDGHVLAGLYGDNLFGYVENGSIKDLALVRSSCGAMVHSLSNGSTLTGCINAANLRLNQPAFVAENAGTLTNCLSAVTYSGGRSVYPFDNIGAGSQCLSIANCNSKSVLMLSLGMPSSVQDTSMMYVDSHGMSCDHTAGLLGTALQSTLGTGWSYTANAYPVPLAFAETNVGNAIAAPVLLAGSETADKVQSDFSLGGASDVDWQVKRGAGVSISGHSASLNYFGTTHLTSSVDDKTYKTVQLNVENPTVRSVFYIKDKEQLGKFRDGINSKNPFYYNPADSTYSNTRDEQHTIMVNAFGLGNYFEQTADIIFDNDPEKYKDCRLIVMPLSNITNTYTVSKAIVLDPGGFNVYPNNISNSIVTLYPKTPGHKLKISGEYNMETNFEFLKIYSGTTTENSALLGSYTGCKAPHNTNSRDVIAGRVPELVSTNPSGALTLSFRSDGGHQEWGFEMFVRDEDEDEDEDVWTPIELNPTIIVSKKSHFMPASGKSDTILVDGDGILYDDLGPARLYSNGYNGTVVLKPAMSGQKVHIEGSGNFEHCNCDVLTIYDGIGKNRELNHYCGGVGTTGVVDLSQIAHTFAFTSTDPSGALTIHFKSDGSVQRWGFQMKYSLENSKTKQPNKDCLHYNGHGHSIRNLCGNLFDTLKMARIQNLNMEDVLKKGLVNFAGCMATYCDESEIKGCTISTPNFYGNQIGGFVGLAELSQIRDCHFNGHIQASAIGAGIVAEGRGMLIENCTTAGKIESESQIGGIVGKNSVSEHSATMIFDTIRHCENGASLVANTSATGTNSIGGIGNTLTTLAVIDHCINTGDIVSKVSNATIGGIVATGGQVDHCINTGRLQLNVFANVGGIAGTSSTVNNSINAGVIQVKKGTGLGAIGGTSVNAINCYNIGKMQWTSLTSNATHTNVHNDQQMCPEFADVATQHSTRNMLGDLLQGKLGADSNWVFTAELYPRIKGIENHPASIAAATPVFLAENEDVLSVNTDFTMGTGTAANTKWSVLEGEALTLDSVNNCRATITGTGIVTLGAAVQDSVYKKVELYVGYKEFIVRNLQELMNFRDCINSDSIFFYDPTPGAEHYALTQENANMIPVPVGGRTISFRLTSDIDMDTITSWDPIGNFKADLNYPVFNGNFNGDHHTIRNMSIVGESQSYLGLFGCASDSTRLKNIHFENIDISTTGDYVGALVGYNGGCIDSCSVVNATMSGGNFVAGMVGYNKGHIDSCRVDSSNVRITKYQDTEITNVALCVGAVAGQCQDTVSHCVAVSDTIYAKNTLSANDFGAICIGGVVGLASSAVLHCYAENDTLFGDNNTTIYGGAIAAGYVVGDVRGNLYDCSTQGGKVSVIYSKYNRNREFYWGTGGVAGVAWGDASYCYNRGAEVKGIQNTGGVVGYSLNAKTYSYCGNTGKVFGNNNTGGVFGCCAAGSTFRYCYNTATVSALQQGDRDANECGGIVGYINGGSLNYCFNTGRITGSSISGGNTGGIAGANTTVNYCFNAGEVVGNSAPYVGGIVGQGTVNYCYNIGQVKGGLTRKGGLSGTQAAPTKSCYDKQMCPNTTFNAGKDSLTRSMLGTMLEGGKMAANVACDSNWKFVSGLYPQLKYFATCEDTTARNAQLAAVTPVILYTDLSAETPVVDDVTNVLNDLMVGTDHNVQWRRTAGTAISLSGNIGHPSGTIGVATFMASVNGVDYKEVRFQSGDQMVIKDLPNLRIFREGINEGIAFHYNITDSTFSTGDTCTDETVWIEVPVGGEGFTFILLPNDYDLSEDAPWTPIGNETNYFRGSFEGSHNVIENLSVVGGNYAGFFGKAVSGFIRNLDFTDARIEGAGDYVGVLCGNLIARVDSCHLLRDTIIASGLYVGGLVGYLYGDSLRCCSNRQGSITTASNYLGGLVGYANGINFDSVYCENIQVVSTMAAADASGHTGGICGAMNYGSFHNCHTCGGLVKSARNYVGGIAGYHYSNSGDAKYYITYCSNTAEVQGRSAVGGIVGGDYTTVRFSHNHGKVTGSGYTGGIAGLRVGVHYCYNTGEVTSSYRPGGILGGTTFNGGVYNCFNLGTVIHTGSGEWAGGITATDVVPNHCFNAGEVMGRSTSNAAGITGHTYATNSINVARVSGYNAVRAVSVNNQSPTCFYDRQMVPAIVVSDGSTALNTTEMLYNALEGNLGNQWIYEPGMYPRLRWTDTCDWARDAAIAAATPLILNTEPELQTVDGISSRTALSGAGIVNWGLTNSGGFTINTESNVQYLNVPDRMARSTLTVSVNDSLYKKIRIGNITKENPIIIKNLTEFVNFRNYINSGAVCYYNTEDYTFHTTKDNEDWIELPVQGFNTYFRLDTDLDLSAYTQWDPVGNNGTSAKRFAGYFNGNHKMVSNLRQSGGNCKGLFGYVYAGSIEDLTLNNINISGNDSYKGALCGYAGRFTIVNCNVNVASLSGQHVGGLVGYASNTTIDSCKVSSSVISHSTYSYLGGVVGYLDNSSLRASSFSGTGVKTTNNGRYVGGVCGYALNSTISDCYNSAPVVGADAGGVCGYMAGGSLTRCFNAGIISGNNATVAYNVGGVVGTVNTTASDATPAGTTISHCYNTNYVNGNNAKYTGGILGYGAMSTVSCAYNTGVIDGGEGEALAIMGNNTTYSEAVYNDMQQNPNMEYDNLLTTKMLGTTLQSGLGSEYWVYENDLYPRLKSMADNDAAVVGANPVILFGNQHHLQTRTPFTVGTSYNATWSHIGTGRSLDVSDLSNGNVGIHNCGEDTLVCSRNDYSKTYIFNIDKLQLLILKEHTCGEPFFWEAANKTYMRSGTYIATFMSCTAGCDSIVTLELSIPKPLSLSTGFENVKCKGANDGWARAYVTGGFSDEGCGPYYSWVNVEAPDDTISRSLSADNLGPGTYVFTVTDILYRDCYLSDTVVITEPDSLLFHITANSSNCYAADDGTIELHIQGGTAPYYVSWQGTNGGSTGQRSYSLASDSTYILTDLPDGDYVVSVKDGNNCMTGDTSCSIADDDTHYEIVANSITTMYDNAEHTVSTYTLTINDGTPEELSNGERLIKETDDYKDYLRVHITGASRTDVGVSSNTVDTCIVIRRYTDVTLPNDTVTCHYNIDYTDGAVTITKRTVVLTTATQVELLSHGPLHNETVEVTRDGFAPGHSITYTNFPTLSTVGAISNKPDTTHNGGISDDNYDITMVYGTLALRTDDNVIVFSAATDSKMYDGTALTNGAITTVGLPEGYTVTATVNGTITDAGSVPNKIDSASIHIFDGGGNDVTATYPNKLLVPGTLTVTKRTVTLTSQSASKVYDGTPLVRSTLTQTGDGFASTDVIGEISVTGTVTDVDTVVNTISYTTTAAFKETNYNLTKTEGSLSVTARPLTITGDSLALYYDGQNHEVTYYSASSLAPGHTTAGLTYTTGTHLEVGRYPGVFTGTLAVYDASDPAQDVTANYQIATPYATGDLVINQRPEQITISSESDEKYYDKTPLTNNNYTVMFGGVRVPMASEGKYVIPATGDTLRINGSGASITNAGRIENSFTYTIDHPSNYKNAILSMGWLTVKPLHIIIKKGSATKEYDGTPLTDTEVDYDGDQFADGEGLIVTSHASITRVGTIDNTMEYEFMEGTLAQNYNVDTVVGTLTVNSTDKAIVISSPSTEWTYDGTDHHDYNYIVTFDEVAQTGVDTTYGQYFVLPTHDTLAVKADENAHITNVGTQTNNFTYELQNSDCYSTPIAVVGTLTVNKATLNIAINDSKTYDATALVTDYTALADTLVVTGLVEGDTLTSGVVTTNNTIAQTYLDSAETYASVITTAFATKKGIANYEVTYDFTQTINKRTVKLTSSDDQKIYDGTALTNSTVSVSEDGWVSGQGAEYSVIGTQTSAGSSSNTFTYTLNTGTSADNYEITKVEGTLTVTPRALAITLDTSKVYDGIAFVSEYASTGRGFTTSGLQNGATVTAGAVTSSAATVGTYTDSSATAAAAITTAFATSDGIGNYNVTYDFSQEITKASCITLTCPMGEAVTKVYDATALQPAATATTTIAGDIIKVEYKTDATEWSETPASITNVGSLAVDVRATNPNYDTATCSYTLTINQRPITVTGRDTNFYFDGLGHSAAQMSTPRYILHDSTQLVGGHNLVTDVTSKTINALDDTAHTVVGTVTITDASSNDVTVNYAITKVDGVIKIKGYPQKLTISSESHQFDCYNKGQKYEHYTVKYGETTCAAVEGSDYKFVIVPVPGIHDTLTITSTCLGTTSAGSSDNVKNTFTYVLQNNIQYVGTRDTVYGYLTQPDTLTLTLTSDNPVCDDGSVMSFTTGGNGGNKFKLNEAAEDDLGIYNHLSADSYTVTVTDSKGCIATASVTLTNVEVTPIEGITRGGEITSYAPDTTVDASGDLTDFPALTASGEIIAQPVLSGCTALVTDHTVSVSVNVDAIGAAPVLELEVATNNAFDATTPMYTHKVVLTATGTQSHDFDNLPAGTYYVRAKLYNCSGSIVSESQTAVVE